MSNFNDQSELDFSIQLPKLEGENAQDSYKRTILRSIDLLIKESDDPTLIQNYLNLRAMYDAVDGAKTA